METHSFAYAETQHRGVRAHLMKEPESSHNLVVQRSELFFGKGINIDLAQLLGVQQDAPILSETSASQQNCLAVARGGGCGRDRRRFCVWVFPLPLLATSSQP